VYCGVVASNWMPELPEVEVTRRQLLPLLVGRTIAVVTTTAPSYFFLTPPSRLRRALRGRQVLGLDRVGKYLLAALDGGERLLLHLGMTGQLFGAGAASVRLLSSTAGAALAPEAQHAFRPDAHTHLRLRFVDGGPDVLFRDVRKFGKVQLLRAGERCERLERLGVDALHARGEPLYASTRRRAAPVKSVLLDQSVLAGVGNIYADEALFLARVRPIRPARRLSLAEWRAVAAAVRRVLRRSIATGGSSISDYVQPDGSDGRYQDERRAYGRSGEPCRRCRTPIRRIVIGARATHFCPRCQR
jgi:formamidopyrimidine-DNA glycosylase